MDTGDLSRVDHIVVSEAAIDVAALTMAVSHPSAGATVAFLGTVRDHSPGHPGVTRLDYEAYREVVEDKIAGVVADLRSRFRVTGVALQHRLGPLAVGEVTVAAVVSAAHRDQAFPAARFLIDEVKASAPIWKKEHWEGGAEWVQESDHEESAAGHPEGP